jgi:succinate-semialdehyde dehydrogenase / glutarate-semialdehyde dehydrogenase
MAGTISMDGVVESVPRTLLVGGEWREAARGARFDVEDPSTGEVLTEVADAGGADAVAALDAAAGVQEAWAATPPSERADMLTRVYLRLLEERERFALLISLEMGKPLAEARGEVGYAAEFVRWYAGAALRIDGRYTRHPSGPGRIITTRQPVGPCLLITPWNFPLAMATRKIAPALAAGCTSLVKPAEASPLSTLAFARLLEDAGVPPGVVNVLTTSRPPDVVEPLMADRRLRKLSFTGSTAVGKALMEQAADQVLRVSLELGGNAPFLICEDADLDAAVEGALFAKMRNAGQACTAANRFYVHRSLHDAFVDRMTERIGLLRVGGALDPATDIGPVVDGPTARRLEELVATGADEGATVFAGEAASGGHFVAPTLLSGVAPDAAVLRGEIFGPIAPVVAFDDEEDAIRAANDTPAGLIAYVYSADLGRALDVGERLETGMVAVNRGLVSTASAPFGGTKESGLGREGGLEGIEEYLEVKYLAVP